MNSHEGQVMTFREVVGFLRVSESTVYGLLRSGKLPGKKIGGQWRVWRPALEAYLEDRPTEPEAIASPLPEPTSDSAES